MTQTAQESPTSQIVIPLRAEAREHHALSLFNRLYERREREPFTSPRRTIFDDASSRAVRLLEARRRETRRVRYRMRAEGPFSVVEWVARYDGRDALTGYAKHTIARFNSFEDAERFVAGEYDEGEACEALVEIEGPYCPVRLPLFLNGSADNDLPF